jgi:3-oxoacyl-[acyl-carrier-protein] synthase-3
MALSFEIVTASLLIIASRVIKTMVDYAAITGWGKCVPPAILTNDDIATVIDTSDEWIKTRSGISERRVSHVPCSDLATVAGQRALAAADVSADDVDLLIVATCTPDTVIPSTAAHVQRKLGASNAAVLFGDSAGAVVVEPSAEESGLLFSHLGCEGEAADALHLPNFGTATNRFAGDYDLFEHRFDGREIFRRAVKGMARETNIVLDELGLTEADIDVVIPHQANLRIIQSLAKYLKVDMSKVEVNIQKYGNTSAATIPVAMVEALEAGRIHAGDRILLAAFGAGLTRAAGVVRWGSRTTPLQQSDAELPPCNQTALELLGEAIKNTL